MTDITGDTHIKFFKVFIQWMTTAKYARHVRMPMAEQEIGHTTRNYEHHGVPGCIGSINAVHFAWNMCPAGLLSNCKGKEGYPTLAFQAIVSHTRKVLGVSGPYYGTWKDKTISRHDENVAMFKEAPYNTLEWKYDNENGDECFDKGAYLIGDGGYQSWPVFICPLKTNQMVRTFRAGRGSLNRFGRMSNAHSAS
jgi:hypothetical protein